MKVPFQHAFPKGLLAGLMALAGCAAVPTLEGPDPADEIVAFYTERMGAPACSVAVIRPEGTVFAGNPHAIYRVASLTKLFLHSAVRRLEAEGRLDPEASVAATAPFALPPEYRDITLRDLLENRSGLPRDFLNPWNPLDWHTALSCGLFGTHIYGDIESPSVLARELASARIRECLRAREAQYSNIGYALLTLCVEHVLGKSVDAILAETVVRPLGLADTAFVPSAEMTARLTPPCAGKLPWLVSRGNRVSDHPLGPALRGMGGLKSSAADCARFFTTCYRPLIEADLAERALAERREGEDVGLLRVKRLPSGRRILYRFGMIYGGASFVCFDPASHTTLVILRNVTSWPAAEDFLLAERLLR